MRFRSILLLVTFGLVALFVAALVPSIGLVIDRSVRRELQRGLERGRQSFHDQWALRQSLYRSESRVVADEPRVKSLAATQDIDHETVLGVAEDVRHAMGQDLLLIGDERGRLLADVTNPGAHGASLTSLPVVGKALESGHAAGVWTRESKAYVVHGRQIRFGRRVEGLVVLGYAIADGFARAVHRQTGNPVAILLDDQIIASSLDGELERADRARLIETLQGLPPDESSAEVELGGARYLALGGDIEGYDGDRSLRFMLLRSLDRALEPSRQLKRIVYQVAFGGLVVAALVGVVVARRLSRPLDELVGFTDRVASGVLEARAIEGGTRETRTLGRAMNRMVIEMEESRRQMAAKERLEREMEIASRLQTSLLPPSPQAPQLDIAATMLAATEVGGDYYDVLRAEGDGCWLAIGDVAGHGLPAGLVMFMAQVGTTAIVRQQPDAGPAQVLCHLNELLYRNIRLRFRSDEHMTFMLMKHEGQGRFIHAGAHEDIVVYRKRSKKCELVPTYGTWLGAMLDIRDVTTEQELQLEPGDLMLLISDGMFEVRNERKEMFGMARLCETVESVPDVERAPVDAIRRHMVDTVTGWGAVEDDDLTLMVVRYLGPQSTG